MRDGLYVSFGRISREGVCALHQQCLRLGHSGGRAGGIIRRRTRSLILDSGGTSTRIEGHLTHQLRVRHEISLKYVEVISRRL
jgi:hypothetical protein